MQRKSAGAVLALVVVFVGGACGSTQAVRQPRPVTTSKSITMEAPRVSLALPAEANLVLVPTQRGAGDEQLGTFTASGTVYFEFSCKGKGPLTLVGILSHISPCDGSPTGASVPYHAGERVRLAVQAKPGTTWRLAVGEHVPGASLAVVDRSGVGNKSLGTFHLQGTVRVATSCTGKGQFTVRFTSRSQQRSFTDLSTYCPEGLEDFTAADVPPGVSGVAISVEAGPKARWKVRISETNRAATSARR